MRRVRSTSIERLAALGYETLSAENGDVAYSILIGGAVVDLVFSDVVMPGTMNGFDLAAKVAEEFPQGEGFAHIRLCE